jgi:anti-sigma factor RsiW
MATDDEPQLTSEELADLTALADGSIDASRRPAVEARIAAAPATRELFERERDVVKILHQARADTHAPASLRERVDGDRRAATRTRSRRRLGFAGGLAALAAVAIVAVVLSGSTSPQPPSVAHVATLALRGPSAPAPGPAPGDPVTRLAAQVGDIYFPNYAVLNSYTAVGQRRDLVSDRTAVTVFYARDGKRVAYTIVGGPALSEPAGQAWAGGYKFLTVGPRTVITWRRDGHTCVMSATGVSRAVLLQMAQYVPA